MVSPAHNTPVWEHVVSTPVLRPIQLEGSGLSPGEPTTAAAAASPRATAPPPSAADAAPLSTSRKPLPPVPQTEEVGQQAASSFGPKLGPSLPLSHQAPSSSPPAGTAPTQVTPSSGTTGNPADARRTRLASMPVVMKPGHRPSLPAVPTWDGVDNPAETRREGDTAPPPRAIGKPLERPAHMAMAGRRSGELRSPRPERQPVHDSSPKSPAAEIQWSPPAGAAPPDVALAPAPPTATEPLDSSATGSSPSPETPVQPQPEHSREAFLEDAVEPPKPRPRCKEQMHAALRDFPFCTAHCPLLMGFLSLFVIPGISGALWPGINIQTSFGSFLEADGQTSLIQAAVSSAMNLRGLSGGGRRLDSDTDELGLRRLAMLQPVVDSSNMYKEYSLNIGYVADANGIWPHLWRIRDFELSLRSLPRWTLLCTTMTTPLLPRACEPGYSLANVVFAQNPLANTGLLNISAQTLPLLFDGRGSGPTLQSQLYGLLASQGMDSFTLTADQNRSLPPTTIKSYFMFHILCCRLSDTMAFRASQLKAINSVYNEFVAKDLVPNLVKFKNASKEFGLDVVWDGDSISEYELSQAIQGDALFACGSVTLILLYMRLHTASWIVSILSLLMMLLSIPVAYVSSAIISSSTNISIACLLSVFLVVGIGADSVLMFYTFWELSKTKFPLEDRTARLNYVLRTAGVGCIPPAISTACSFFSNLTSVLRALRQFGFFMGVCLVWVNVLMCLVLPALLVIEEVVALRCARWRRCKSESIDCASIRASIASKFPDFQHLIGLFIDRLLARFKYSMCVIFLMIIIGTGVWAALVAKVNGGTPQVFAAGYNQQDKIAVFSRFGNAWAAWSNPKSNLCILGPTIGAGDGECDMFWCEVNQDQRPPPVLGSRPVQGLSTCSCVPTTLQSSSCTPSSLGTVDTRFVGLELAAVPSSLWRSSSWLTQVRNLLCAANSLDCGTANLTYVGQIGKATELASIVQEDWEAGTNVSRPFFAAPMVGFTAGRNLCSASQVCYCGAPTCTTFGQQPITAPASQQLRSDVTISIAARRMEDTEVHEPAAGMVPEPASLQGRRRLQDSSQISIVWGIEVIGEVPLLGDAPTNLYRFSSAFMAESPSVQRFIFLSCSSWTAPKFQHLDSNCWISNFRSWLVARGEIFPTVGVRFNSLLVSWARTAVLPGGTAAQDMMWFDSTRSKMIATMITVKVAVPGDTGAHKIAEYKANWDALLSSMNAAAPADAGDALHSSSLWMRADAEASIVESTVAAIGVGVTTTFVVGVVATGVDLGLALLVALSVVGVTFCLAWFMAVVLGWPFGAIEVLGLIIFVGYSDTYSLHVAQKYRSHILEHEHEGGTPQSRRLAAVTYALTAVCSAVVGCAATTVGSAFFLFFCTIQFFVKLAAIMFSMTLFSLVAGLSGLPVALLCCGPSKDFSLLNCCLDRMGGLVHKSLSSVAGEPPPPSVNATARHKPLRGAASSTMMGARSPTSSEVFANASPQLARLQRAGRAVQTQAQAAHMFLDLAHTREQSPQGRGTGPLRLQGSFTTPRAPPGRPSAE